MIRRYKHRLPWLLLFALACVVEWAAGKVKEWAGGKLLAPAPPEEPQR